MTRPLLKPLQRLWVLWWTLSWPEVRLHPWRHGVAVPAVMLGVGLALSVHWINASALAEFSSAVRAANGEPDALSMAAVHAGLMPRLSDTADRLDLLGADTVFLNPAAQALLDASIVEMQVGWEPSRLRVAGTVGLAGSPLLVMDVGALQHLLGQPEHITRVDLRLQPGADARGLLAQWQTHPVVDARWEPQALLLQGEAGWSRKGPEPTQASLYYTQPQLAVEGTVRIKGQQRRVRGRAWLDHEWSEALLHPEAVGWDWTGMNLLDGGALTAFRLRRADGSTLWTGGSYRPAHAAQSMSPPLVFGPDAVVFTPLRHWFSPVTQIRYPVDWRIDTPAGGFELRTLLDAQELDSRATTGAIYWEGLSHLHRLGRSDVVGRGYLEMTGYGERIRLG